MAGACASADATRKPSTRPLSITVPLPPAEPPAFGIALFSSQSNAPIMSSPTQRRSQRSSASATPRRSARSARSSHAPSSPAPGGPDEQLQSEASQASQRVSQATPRNARLQSASTQSPLFFRSSPANASGSGAANDAPESDGGATPRASGMTIGGIPPLQPQYLDFL